MEQRAHTTPRTVEPSAIAVSQVLLGVVIMVVAALAEPLMGVALALLLLVRGGVDLVAELRRGEARSATRLTVSGLTISAGVLLLVWPRVGASAFSLVLAGLFLVGGAQKALAPLTRRAESNPFVVMTGIVSILLGVLLLALWPIERYMILGVLAGLEILINGMTISLVSRVSHRPTHAYKSGGHP